MKYRMLKNGELLKLGDEFHCDWSNEWRLVLFNLGVAYDKFLGRVRRPIKKRRARQNKAGRVA